MTSTIKNLTVSALALAATIAASSTAHAMNIVCTIKEVGVHDGGLSTARAFARCETPVSGVEFIAVPFSSGELLADRFLDVMTTAFLSGRTIWAWAPTTGSNCSGTCRVTNQFLVAKP